MLFQLIKGELLTTITPPVSPNKNLLIGITQQALLEAAGLEEMDRHGIVVAIA